MSVSNIASAALVASSLRGGNAQSESSQPDTIKQSVAGKPIQWLIVAGVVGYFGYKILKDLVKTGDEKKAADAETSSQNNPWAFETFLDWSKVPKGTKILQYEEAKAKAKIIFDALDTYFKDSEDIVVGVFAALPSQLQVSQVANAFYYNNNFRDLLTYLKNGNKTFDLWTGGISQEKYDRIIANVAKKPKY
jgi:hypothetical protein